MTTDLLRVLYVDDEPTLLKICKIFLEKTGNISVDTLTSPLDALELITDTPYDAIICDFQMPAMDGIIFLKKIRSLCFLAPNLIPFTPDNIAHLLIPDSVIIFIKKTDASIPD